MSIAIGEGICEGDEITGDIDAIEYAWMALDLSTWENRKISRNKKSDFCKELQEKIRDLYLKDIVFQQLALKFIQHGNFGWGGKRDIEEIKFGKSRLKELGFGKSLYKFWKKHKVPILIGAGVAAVVGAIIVVTIFTAGTATGVVVAAGTAVIDELTQETPPTQEPAKEIDATAEVAASAPPAPTLESNQEAEKESPNLEPLTPVVTEVRTAPDFMTSTLYTPDGIWINEQFYPYLSDLKAADPQFIAGLPSEFVHNHVSNLPPSVSNANFLWSGKLATNNPSNLFLQEQPSLQIFAAGSDANLCPYNPFLIGNEVSLLTSGEINSLTLSLQNYEKPVLPLHTFSIPTSIGLSTFADQVVLDNSLFMPTNPTNIPWVNETFQLIAKGVIDTSFVLDPLTSFNFSQPTTIQWINESLQLIGQNIINNPSFPKEPIFLIPEQLPTSWKERTFSTLTNALNEVGRNIIDNPWLLDPYAILPTAPPASFNLTLRGSLPVWFHGGLINGMNTLEFEKNSHVSYISNFAPKLSIDGIYNRTHGPILDVAEIFTLNYPGVSPNTSDLLLNNWTTFHERNINRPWAKYLQYCHSQGAIHVRNQLLKAPQEIRDRVIVIAIAPAAIVSKKICHQSFNYACKTDPIPNGEIFFGLLTSLLGDPKPLNEALNNREELILLDPLPGSVGLNHDFQNPIFQDVIKEHYTQYVTNYGPPE